MPTRTGALDEGEGVGVVVEELGMTTAMPARPSPAGDRCEVEVATLGRALGCRADRPRAVPSLSQESGEGEE